jgi:hopanoid-associated phosphorylase
MDDVAGLLVVCGLRREAAILSGAGVTALCGDARTLGQTLARLAGTKPRLVLSWGLCGGLDPHLAPGDLIVGSEVVLEGERLATDTGVAEELQRRLREADLKAIPAPFAGVEAPVLTTGGKAALSAATGAAAVDMESVIAGRFAAAEGAPFAILRAVADPAGRSLPPLATKAIDPEGRLSARALVLSLLGNPGQIAQLPPLARDSAAAFATLERCGRLLPGLFVGLGLADL